MHAETRYQGRMTLYEASSMATFKEQDLVATLASHVSVQSSGSTVTPRSDSRPPLANIGGKSLEKHCKA